MTTMKRSILIVFDDDVHEMLEAGAYKYQMTISEYLNHTVRESERIIREAKEQKKLLDGVSAALEGHARHIREAGKMLKDSRPKPERSAYT